MILGLNCVLYCQSIPRMNGLIRTVSPTPNNQGLEDDFWVETEAAIQFPTCQRSVDFVSS